MDRHQEQGEGDSTDALVTAALEQRGNITAAITAVIALVVRLLRQAQSRNRPVQGRAAHVAPGNGHFAATIRDGLPRELAEPIIASGVANPRDWQALTTLMSRLEQSGVPMAPFLRAAAPAINGAVNSSWPQENGPAGDHVRNVARDVHTDVWARGVAERALGNRDAADSLARSALWPQTAGNLAALHQRAASRGADGNQAAKQAVKESADQWKPESGTPFREHVHRSLQARVQEDPRRPDVDPATSSADPVDPDDVDDPENRAKPENRTERGTVESDRVTGPDVPVPPTVTAPVFQQAGRQAPAVPPPRGETAAVFQSAGERPYTLNGSDPGARPVWNGARGAGNRPAPAPAPVMPARQPHGFGNTR